MGTSWAVGAATTLAVFGMFAAQSTLTSGTGTPFAAGTYVLALVAIATWAYAIAVAAHGSRGALAALLANVLVAVVVSILFLARFGVASLSAIVDVGTIASLFVLLVLVGLPSAWAILSELRSRRGVLHWNLLVAFSLPTLLVAVRWAILWLSA